MRPFQSDRFPVFVREGEGFDLWGIPDFKNAGVKIGAGSSAPKPLLNNPADNNRPPGRADHEPAEAACAQGIPQLTPEAVAVSTCMNSRTPDGHFILGVHPALPSVVLAGGFSGHGFKHASGVGQLCVDIALDGSSPIPTDQFSPMRFDAMSSG